MNELNIILFKYYNIKIKILLLLFLLLLEWFVSRNIASSISSVLHDSDGGPLNIRAGWSAISSSKKSLVSDEKEPDLDILHLKIGEIVSSFSLFVDSVWENINLNL